MPFSPIDPDNLRGNLGQPGQTLPNSVGQEALNFNITNAAGAALQQHINNPLDAHMASAIGVVDAGGYFAVDPITGQKNVEDALEALGSLIPPAPNVIGVNTVGVPNSGIPDYTNPSGGWELANTAGTYAYTVGNVATGAIQQTNYVINQPVLSPANTVQMQGIMYPADSGYLAVYVGGNLLASFNIAAQFNNSLRNTGQPNYTYPAVNGVTLQLVNRLPYLKNYGITNPIQYLPYAGNFYNYQIATYILQIPLTYSSNGIGNFVLQQTKSSPPATFSPSTSAFSVVNSTTQLPNVYLDEGTTPPTVSASTLAGPLRSSASPLVFLSGANYYGVNAADAFTVQVKSTTLFNETYLYTTFGGHGLLTVSYPGLNIAAAQVPLSSLVDGSSNPFVSGSNAPLTTSTGTYNATGVVPGANAFSINAASSSTATDPFGTSTSFSSTPVTATALLVDTYTQTAPVGGATNGITDDYTESFVSEIYRYTTNTANGSGGQDDFNSTPANYRATSSTFPVTPPLSGALGNLTYPSNVFIDLAATPSVDNALQCAALPSASNQPGLVWPQTNFFAAYPQGSTGSPYTQPNYSTIPQPNPGTATADRFYYRTFDTKGSRTQMLLSVQGIMTANFTSTASAPPVQVAVKIPGTTAWFDLGTNVGSTSPVYNAGTDPSLNGCQDSSVPGHNPTAGIYGMSFGGATTGSGNALIAVRVRYRGGENGATTPASNAVAVTQLQAQF